MGTKMGMCQLTKTSKRKEGSIPSFIKNENYIIVLFFEGELRSRPFKSSKTFDSIYIRWLMAVILNFDNGNNNCFQTINIDLMEEYSIIKVLNENKHF